MSRVALTLLGVALLLGAVPLVQAAGASTGFVSYTVQSSTPGGVPKTAVVTERITSSSKQGESVVSLAATSAETNFTYSRLVNSSLAVFPYLPSVANETYSSHNDSQSVTASVMKSGTSEATFNGTKYTLTDYSFSVVYSDGNRSGSLAGNVTVLPSGLVYSVEVSSGAGFATATLLSTSLPLQAGTTTAADQAASVGAGASAAAAAVALSLGVRARRKGKPGTPDKPDHWVD